MRAGTIGIAGSVATAARETAVRIHDFGGGVSRVISTGDGRSHDGGTSDAVVDALQSLEDDPATNVIVLVVRRPSSEDERRISQEMLSCTKPIVAFFIGGSAQALARRGAIPARTTKEAALQAVLLTGMRTQEIDQAMILNDGGPSSRDRQAALEPRREPQG